jgi:myo-inositol-1(or 4)-monophosphatase
MIPRVRDVRRSGSAALDLCLAACGRLDAYFEEHLNSWDIAAGVLIAAEAGAVTTDLYGSAVSTTGVVVAGAGIHAALVELINAPR